MKVLHGPYTRILLKNREIDQFLERMKSCFNATIDFQFPHVQTSAVVYAISSDLGKHSVLVSDLPLPPIVIDTRATLVVEDLAATLEVLKNAGLSIVEDKTPVEGVGFQARVALSEHNIFEITQWTNPALSAG